MVLAEVAVAQELTWRKKRAIKPARTADERNMEILAVALQGLNSAESKLDQTAVRISQATAPQNGSSGGTIDLAQEMVNLTSAKQEYLVSLKALQAGADLAKHTIDILA